jgi:hypothetical protein
MTAIPWLKRPFPFQLLNCSYVTGVYCHSFQLATFGTLSFEKAGIMLAPILIPEVGPYVDIILWVIMVCLI